MADEAEATTETAQTSGDGETATVEATTDTGSATESATVTDGEAALGDAGKKALDAMKADRNSAREEARKAREEADQLRAQIEGKEKEYAAEQEKRAIEAEALDKANQRILKAEVRAAAAGKLSDPADALRFIDLSGFEVGTDGEVNASQIASAIDDLIQTKPYLAVQDGKRFQGDVDAGTRKESRPAQLSEQEVKRLYAEGRHDEIVKAKAEGRLADYLAS